MLKAWPLNHPSSSPAPTPVIATTPSASSRPTAFSHLYVIGKTGVGKTTLLENMIVQDIAAGRGCALIDPHGDLVERVAAVCPSGAASDVVYLNVPDSAQPYSYNPLSRVSADKRPLVASGLMEVFEKMWGDAWGVRMEHILRNSLLTLLEQPRATVPDILRLFADKDFRRQAVARVTNEQVKLFWKTEFEQYNFRQRPEVVAPIQNKVGAFLSDPRIHRIVAGSGTPIRLRSIMDEGKVLLVNLAKGKIGDDSCRRVGWTLRHRARPGRLQPRRHTRGEAPPVLHLHRRVPELHHALNREHALRAAQVPGGHDPGAPVSRAA